MNQQVKNFVHKQCKDSVPELKSGYQVRVHQKIKEGNKERIQVFEGIIIKMNAGYGSEATFTVRKVSEGVGVEKIFPIHAPSIQKIDVVRAHKVRRSKLRYLRDLSGKALRLKEVPYSKNEKSFEEEVLHMKEAPKEEKAEEPEAKTEETKTEEPKEVPTEKSEDKTEDKVDAPAKEEAATKEEEAEKKD